MGLIIGLIVALVALVLLLELFGIFIALIVTHWLITLAVIASVVFLCVLYQVRKARRAEELQQAEERARRSAEDASRIERFRNEQLGYLTEMIAMSNGSLDLLEGLPRKLDNAEANLDRAEICFRDGVFAPFWDSIEKATIMLARYDESIRAIKNNAERYAGLSKLYVDKTLSFSITPSAIRGLGAASGTAERLSSMVWRAQSNFQFAAIFEQRRTNQLLISGFANLTDALSRVGSEISGAIESVADSLQSIHSTLEESAREANFNLSNLGESVSRMHRDFSANEESRTSREEKVIDMLDNIQRHRKPFALL